MIIEYTPKAVADAHTAIVSSPREPWYAVAVAAAALQLESMRNRDRPKIAFLKGFRKPR